MPDVGLYWPGFAWCWPDVGLYWPSIGWVLVYVRSSRLPSVDPVPRQKFRLLPRVPHLFCGTGGFSSKESMVYKRE